MFIFDFISALYNLTEMITNCCNRGGNTIFKYINELIATVRKCLFYLLKKGCQYFWQYSVSLLCKAFTNTAHFRYQAAYKTQLVYNVANGKFEQEICSCLD